MQAISKPSVARVVRTLVGSVLTLFAASRLAAGQAPPPGYSMLSVESARDSANNGKFGFVVPFPAATDMDSLAAKVFDGATISKMHTWAFIEPAPKGSSDTRPRRALLNAVMGMRVTEAAWNRQAKVMFEALHTAMPRAEVVENVVRWRADTAEFRLGFHDMAAKQFVNMRCIGSAVGRPQSTVVCVQTVAPTAEELASMRQGLVFTPQGRNVVP